LSKELPEFLSVKVLCGIFGCSRGTIYNWEKKGQFPQRKRLGAQSVGWLKSEIQDHVDNLPSGIDAVPRQLREVQRTGKKIGRKKKRGRPKGKIVTDPGELDYLHSIEPTEEEEKAYWESQNYWESQKK